MLQPLECGHGLVEAGCGHTPGANRCTDQVDGVAGLRQPFAKDVTVQRAQHQAFGATGSAGDHPHILGLESVGFDVFAGCRARVDAQRCHAENCGEKVRQEVSLRR